MKLVAIFRDSKGEPDWLLPFIKFSLSKGIEWELYFYYEKDRLKIIKENQLSNLDINIYCGGWIYYLYKIDTFLDKLENKIKKYSNAKIARLFINLPRIAISSILSNFKLTRKSNILFRDYNLKESIMLNLLSDSHTKYVIFPHAVGIQRSGGNLRDRSSDLPTVRCSLWLENTELSDMALSKYKEQFKAVGVPAFVNNIPSQFDVHSNRVIILTRNCMPEYGFTFEEAFSEYKRLINYLHLNNYTVYLKNHPRDKNADKWISLLNSRDCVINTSLDNIQESFLCCFTLFSTAGIFLIPKKIPILDFSPYNRDYLNIKRVCHYIGEDGRVTHDLLYYRIFNYITINELESMSIDDWLRYIETISNLQYRNLFKYFPNNANENILKYINLLN